MFQIFCQTLFKIFFDSIFVAICRILSAALGDFYIIPRLLFYVNTFFKIFKYLKGKESLPRLSQSPKEVVVSIPRIDDIVLQGKGAAAGIHRDKGEFIDAVSGKTGKG